MEYIAVLLPSAGVGAIFYFAMRAIFGADRAERQAQAAAEQEAHANVNLRAAPSPVEPRQNP
nr:hypothetical protein [Arthrobacter subterraneus]